MWFAPAAIAITLTTSDDEDVCVDDNDDVDEDVCIVNDEDTDDCDEEVVEDGVEVVIRNWQSRGIGRTTGSR